MKKRYARVLGLALTAALTMGLVGCGSTGTATTSTASSTASAETASVEESGTEAAAEESTAKDELIIALNSDATTLDMCEGMGTATATVCMNIFDALTRLDSDGNLQPWLAESFDNIEPTVWQFKLRQGVTFTNGEPFNAEAVKYSFDRQVNEDYAFSMAGDYADITEVEVVDDYTVNFHTAEPFPTLPLRITYLPMMPPEYTEATGVEQFGEAPIGTGAYKLVEWVKDSYITLEANEDYFMGAPEFKTLTFKIIPEDSTRVMAVENKEVDIAMLVPPSQIDSINATDGVSIVSGPASRTMYLGMNTLKEGPLQDVNVRKAICYAVDVPSIIDSVLLGNGVETAALSLSYWDGYDPNVQGYSQDLEKAAELLEEAGYPGGEGLEFNLDVVDGEYPAIKEVAQAIAGQLAEVGINASVVTMDKSTFRGSLKDKSVDDLFVTGFGGITACNPDTMRLILSSGQRYCVYDNQEITDLIAAGTTETDTEKFNSIWSQVQQMVIDDAPVRSLYQLVGIYGVSDDINWTPRMDENILANEITSK